MFELQENRFFEDGICFYEDERKNSAKVSRNDDGFTLKLTFFDERIKAKLLKVKVPVEAGTDGINLKMEYPAGTDINNGPIAETLKDTTTLIDHWINLLYDIKFLTFNNNLLINANPGATEEDAARFKFDQISQYPELSRVVSGVTGVPM